MTYSLPGGRPGQWLAAGLLAIALAVAWIVVAGPMIGWYENRAQNIDERIMLVNRMRNIVAQLPQLQLHASTAGVRNQTKGAFIEGATDAIAGAALEQTMQAMASQLGATLSSGEILAPQAQGPYTQIQLRVSVSGSWPVLMRLLAAIRANQPVLLVDDLQISGAQNMNQPGNSVMNASFVVIAFRTGNVHPNAGAAGSSALLAP